MGHHLLVIRIFGIYTHAQLDGRFWDSVGHQVGRKGKEYRRRCKYRNSPLQKGDYLVLPGVPPVFETISHVQL
jgi:hypothetical protein